VQVKSNQPKTENKKQERANEVMIEYKEQSKAKRQRYIEKPTKKLPLYRLYTSREKNKAKYRRMIFLEEGGRGDGPLYARSMGLDPQFMWFGNRA